MLEKAIPLFTGIFKGAEQNARRGFFLNAPLTR